MLPGRTRRRNGLRQINALDNQTGANDPPSGAASVDVQHCRHPSFGSAVSRASAADLSRPPLCATSLLLAAQESRNAATTAENLEAVIEHPNLAGPVEAHCGGIRSRRLDDQILCEATARN